MEDKLPLDSFEGVLALGQAGCDTVAGFMRKVRTRPKPRPRPHPKHKPETPPETRLNPPGTRLRWCAGSAPSCDRWIAIGGLPQASRRANAKKACKRPVCLPETLRLFRGRFVC